MKRLILPLAAAFAALALPGAASAIGQCGLPSSTPLWLDFGTPEHEHLLGRPGMIAAVSSGAFPARLREKGAKTVYWDMYLNRRVGTPDRPADPAVVVERADRLFDFAARQSGCDKPLIALNELFGAHLETPWTESNARYRANVLAFLRRLAERGARPFLLVSSAPYTASEEAAGWWREAAKVSDLVPEVYFGAPSVWNQGPLVGSRRLRTTMRRALARYLAIGVPPERLGIMLGFQTRRGTGGREGLKPASRWFEVVKLQALAARTVARELGAASIWSWGWATYSAAARDLDKAKALCVYMWTRDPKLCNAPRHAGPFDASRTAGQIRLPSGVHCGFNGYRIRSTQVAALQRLTDDRAVALTVLLARAAESGHAKVTRARVLAAERAVVRLRFRGSRAAYVQAVTKAGGTVAIARGVLADELRRLDLARTMRARRPATSEVVTFYHSYPDLTVRAIDADPAPWWLGNRKSGLALLGLAPERVFSLPAGRESKVAALDGTYTVVAHGEAQPLGAVPIEQARPAIAAALSAFARRAAFESWSVGRQTVLLRRTVCRRDEVPVAGTVRLTSYLPFLSLDGA